VKLVWSWRLTIAVAFLISAVCNCAQAETLRVGVQKTGTFGWQLDVIARHGLARESGLCFWSKLFFHLPFSAYPFARYEL
jgi:hypothetical protein